MVDYCPVGKIRRQAYTRKDGIIVKSSCVKDMGKPGKTSEKNKVLPKPTPGMLAQFGYFDVKNKNMRLRRMALEKSVKNVGYKKTFLRVNLAANLNKSDEKVHKLMRDDMNWMRRNKERLEILHKDAKPKLIKEGKIMIDGKIKQLYRFPSSELKFYKIYKVDKDGKRKLVRKYINNKSMI